MSNLEQMPPPLTEDTGPPSPHTDLSVVPTQTAAAPTMRALATKALRRPHGATVAELCALTGWLPHSTRAFLSGLRKQGTVLVKSKRKSGATAYRIAALAVDA